MNKPEVYVGIDPGAKGAICALMPKTQQAVFLDTTEEPRVILEWFNQLKLECDVRVIMIEEVHSIFGMSAKSNFSFGRNVERVNTIALLTSLMVDLVQPKKWQKAVGVKQKAKGPEIKKEVAALCKRLYPNVNVHGPKGGLHDGKSDALMLAHYAKLIHK